MGTGEILNLNKNLEIWALNLNFLSHLNVLKAACRSIRRPDDRYHKISTQNSQVIDSLCSTCRLQPKTKPFKFFHFTVFSRTSQPEEVEMYRLWEHLSLPVLWRRSESGEEPRCRRLLSPAAGHAPPVMESRSRAAVCQRVYLNSEAFYSTPDLHRAKTSLTAHFILSWQCVSFNGYCLWVTNPPPRKVVPGINTAVATRQQHF